MNAASPVYGEEPELVLGHAWRPKSHKSWNDRPDIEELDTLLMEANDIIDVPLYVPFCTGCQWISLDITGSRRG